MVHSAEIRSALHRNYGVGQNEKSMQGRSIFIQFSQQKQEIGSIIIPNTIFSKKHELSIIKQIFLR